MMIAADKNKDGFIDVQEFNDHFYNVLKYIKSNLALEKLATI